MSRGFADQVAIVTGGASGIGRSLASALVRAGARVVVADTDGERAEAVARELGERARSEIVNVTDSVALRRAIEGTAAREGRLDLLFNNAGIAVFADARDTSLDDWNRQIDVNLRGVVHGIVAAYPLMLRQGSGHIVNTASAAGLIPSPATIAYAATKHAVVGLSLTLRAEARPHGVRVSVVCPGVIETPMVQTAKLVGPTRERVLAALPLRLHSPDRLAAAVLRGVARNRAIIPFTPELRFLWALHRLSPRLSLAIMGRWYRTTPFYRGRGD
ncbi:MAG: SDR family oxidoreductase [Deltaproteobacteria bacterium]|nr:SDR family oxidoreductase [Deltaproteobacteria bacterium]